MPNISGEELKNRLIQAQKALEDIRSLTEKFIRHRIREYRQWTSTEEDEIVEKVFQQVGRALSSYDRDRAANPFSWYMTVVDNRVKDYCRAHKIPVESLSQPRQIGDEEDLEPPEPPDLESRTPSSAHRQLEAHKILIEAMSRLSSPREREMLLLVTLFPELPYEEIIKITGHPTVNAAKELRYRTMKEMRAILADMGYGWEMFGEVFRPE